MGQQATGPNPDCCRFLCSSWAHNDVHIFKWLGKKKKNPKKNISPYVKITPNSNFSVHQVLLECRLLMYSHIVYHCFLCYNRVKQLRWTVWPTKTKILTYVALYENACQPLIYVIVHSHVCYSQHKIAAKICNSSKS